MAIFYTITDEEGRKRWYITEKEAESARKSGGEKVDRSEIDEIEAREMAAKWLNMSEKARETAKKRESEKSDKRKSEIAKKVWAKRRENGTTKWKNKE